MTRFLTNDLLVNIGEIVIKNNKGCGSIFYKTTSKKVFKKWTIRCFFVSNKEFYFWKQKIKRRVKKISIPFTYFCKVSGIQCCNDKFGEFIKFNLFYKRRNKLKTYVFKSYEVEKMLEVYKIINNNMFNKFHGKYTD
jgi:hypothetical protein